MSRPNIQFYVNSAAALILVFGADFVFGTDSVIRLLAFVYLLNFFTECTDRALLDKQE